MQACQGLGGSQNSEMGTIDFCYLLYIGKVLLVPTVPLPPRLSTVPPVLHAWYLNWHGVVKLNYRKKVFYFTLNYLPWEFLLIKNWISKKLRPPCIHLLKLKTEVVLVFLISNFLLTKISWEGNWVRFSCSNSALETTYSRVHISSDTAFLKILKKLSIVQE